MQLHTRINLVLAAMVSLCLGSVMAAQTPEINSHPTVMVVAPVAMADSLSQRAEMLAVDLLLETTPCSKTQCANDIPALARTQSVGDLIKLERTGAASGIDMPFFSFGGMNGAE